MKKTGALLATTIAMLAMTSSADARAKAPGEIVDYGFALASPTQAVVFGQLFSDEKSCVAKRKYEMVAKTDGTKKVVDSGKTSKEGAISGFVTSQEFPEDTSVSFSVAKTKSCAKVNQVVEESDPVRAAATGRATAGVVNVLDVNGEGKDGAVAGLITSNKSKCVKGRKLQLKVNGKVTDKGKTTKDGAFALHITAKEFDPDNTVAVVMSKSNGCAAGSGQVPVGIT